MSYTLSISAALGSGQTGLTLKAQLVDTTGANVGDEVTTGFVEIGAGNYLWTHGEFPDDFRGGVLFYTGTLPTGLKAFLALNPEEAEYLDLPVSEIAGGVALAPTAAQIWSYASRTVTLIHHGDGPIAIDHDYGGEDALAVRTAEGAGVAGADVIVYLASDYANGARGSAYVRGRSVTDAQGRWSWPVLLWPGDYRIVVGSPGVLRPVVVDVTVE